MKKLSTILILVATVPFALFASTATAAPGKTKHVVHHFNKCGMNTIKAIAHPIIRDPGPRPGRLHPAGPASVFAPPRD